VAAQLGPPQRSAAQVRELLADVRARRLARLPAGDQRRPRLEHERLHLLAAALEHRRDLVMGHVAELRQDECRALVLRQRRHVAQQSAQVVPALDRGGEVLGRRVGHLADRLPPAGPQRREAAVAGDRVQPRPQLDRLVGPDELAEGREERVLDRVLGLLDGAEHVAAEGKDAAVVAIEDRFEGCLGAAADALDEPVVGCEAQ
jgi:hypothetical protein